MLKRLYVHNYKCLVNFEINFDQDVSLFLGANGSGKSTVFEVLNKLRRVIIDEEKVENIFDDIIDTPRWLDTHDSDIRFELEVIIRNSIYKYVLVIGFVRCSSIIKEESLYKDNEILVISKDNEIILNDSNLPFLFDNSRSSIKRYSQKSIGFINFLNSLFIVRINPYEILTLFNRSNIKIKTDCSNYAEWFAYFNENNRRSVSLLENCLRDVIPRFDIFIIQNAGQTRELIVEFKHPTNKNKIIQYFFNELSEGQKVLIVLYTLIYCTPDNSVICIDEPENFLALPEIQPWLNAMRDQCSERNLQVILISHHPSLINFLAASSGYWFSRQDNHTRIEKIAGQDEGELSLAQLIEMGWIYGD